MTLSSLEGDAAAPLALPVPAARGRSREIARWGAYAVALAVPGSFFVLPTVWLAKYLVLRTHNLRQMRASRRAQTH
jgi:hypothetical protein